MSTAAPVNGEPILTRSEMMTYVSRANDRTNRIIKEESVEIRRGVDMLRHDMSERFVTIERQQQAHDDWHRDQLAAQLAATGPARLNGAQTLLMALTMLVAIVAIIVPLVHR